MNTSKERIIRLGGIALVVVAELLGGGEAKPIHATGENTPTPVSTPSKSPTPDLDTQIANKSATVTILEGRLPKAAQLAKLNAREAAILAQIDAYQRTPTPTPGPNVICLSPQDLDKLIQNGVQAELASIPTPTPAPRPTTPAPTSAVGSENKGNEGGDPWRNILVVGGILAAGALAVRVFRRKIAEGVRGIRNRSGRTPPPIGTGRP